MNDKVKFFRFISLVISLLVLFYCLFIGPAFVIAVRADFNLETFYAVYYPIFYLARLGPFRPMAEDCIDEYTHWWLEITDTPFGC